MINTIDFENGQIKYWIDELPSININNYLSKGENIRLQCGRVFANTKVALEIFLHKNASYYGLLGVEYFPALETEDLKVSFNYTTKNEFEYKDTILQYDEKVFMGLAEEYLSYTQNNIKTYLSESNKIQAGLLNFTVAAHSEVGSSSKIFSRLSEMLVELIVKTNKKQDGLGIDDIVKEILYSSSLLAK